MAGGKEEEGGFSLIKRALKITTTKCNEGTLIQSVKNLFFLFFGLVVLGIWDLSSLTQN